jgi:hypothetical protein
MSYSLTAISSILEVPALFSAFANTNGFITDNTVPDQPIITAPDPTDAVSFRVRALEAGLTHTLTIEPVDDPDVTGLAFFNSPRINNVVSTPTAVAFIGGQLPQPFIACVVFYGDNLVRHLYYGYMEKLGGYTGGEVISASNAPNAPSPSPRTYRDNSYLFNGRQANTALAQSGGVLARHAGNPTPFRRFRATTSLSPITAFTNGDAIGGFGDDVNDGYMVRGRSPFAGLNLLSPINLFAPEPILGECSFRPLGTPAGVRLVNMRDLAVGARIEIAGEYWRCYPATRRSTDTTMPVGTGNYLSRETSFMVGYAYYEG